MLWLALLPNVPLQASCTDDAVAGLCHWGLQFTPRVAVLPAAPGAAYPPAVVLELASSLRLFGGWQALAQRVAHEAPQLGVKAGAWADTSLAAVALARARAHAAAGYDAVANPAAAPMPSSPLLGSTGLLYAATRMPQPPHVRWVAAQLNQLPLQVLDALQMHAAMLERLGCRTLGQVRALPRNGVARRFGRAMLLALDQAYGQLPETHAWLPPPDTFQARLELPARVETALAILHGARRLLLQLCGWLLARCSGVTVFTLRWQHDTMRARNIGAGGCLQVRTAGPMRQPEVLLRLLAEHLAHVALEAPVGYLALQADETQPLPDDSHSLLPDRQAEEGALAEVLTRMAARLGEQQVLRPVLCNDHRPEWQVQWQPATQALPRSMPVLAALPQPGFLLPQPLALATNTRQLPLYQGALQLVCGPHRIEAGWWHPQAGATVLRDYWVALSASAGVLWIFQTRLASEAGAWYLHGVFA